MFHSCYCIHSRTISPSWQAAVAKDIQQVFEIFKGANTPKDKLKALNIKCQQATVVILLGFERMRQNQYFQNQIFNASHEPAGESCFTISLYFESSGLQLPFSTSLLASTPKATRNCLRYKILHLDARSVLLHTLHSTRHSGNGHVEQGTVEDGSINLCGFLVILCFIFIRTYTCAALGNRSTQHNNITCVFSSEYQKTRHSRRIIPSQGIGFSILVFL